MDRRGIFVDAGYLFAAEGHLGRAGQFILTGSANPPDKLTRHSGAGRVLCVGMRPMSPFESLVVRDLRIYGQAAGCDLWHYRVRQQRRPPGGALVRDDPVDELPDTAARVGPRW